MFHQDNDGDDIYYTSLLLQVFVLGVVQDYAICLLSQ